MLNKRCITLLRQIVTLHLRRGIGYLEILKDFEFADYYEATMPSNRGNEERVKRPTINF